MNCRTKWVGVALVVFLSSGCNTILNLVSVTFDGEKGKRAIPDVKEQAAQEDTEGTSRRANTASPPPQSEYSPGLGNFLSRNVKPPSECDPSPWALGHRVDMPVTPKASAPEVPSP
jgi:hypothetical protein